MRQDHALQANWIKALDNTLEQLNAVKADFYQHLSQWQKALYPRKGKALADCYLELYRILNVEKLLREEVVFQADQPQAGPSPKTVEGLHKLNKTLTKFLRHFEAALDGLGLYAYFPSRENCLMRCVIRPRMRMRYVRARPSSSASSPALPKNPAMAARMT